METEMAERVARVLARFDIEGDSLDWPPELNTPEHINECINSDWRCWEIRALAVIEAMREPTIAMYDFGTDKMWKDRNSTEVWQSMIDAALTLAKQVA